MNVAWFSAGVSSAVATKLFIADHPDAIVIYTHIDDAHHDNTRFIKDCEEWFGKKITVLYPMYKTVDEACRAACFVNSVRGAACTDRLKRRTRKQWERVNPGIHTYMWGMDCKEINRTNGIENAMPEYLHSFPLVEKRITKEHAHGMLAKVGIKRPVMYDMGYNNNNCIGCVKGGMGYWNKIRVDFPDVFKSRCDMERAIGGTCLKGKMFLDELEPNRGRMSDEVMEDCGLFCEILK